MANIFDYIKWRGDLDFTQSPFNPVDNIIFSQLSYLPFDGIVNGPDEKGSISASLALKKLNDFPKSKSDLMFRQDPALIAALAASKRFGNCRLFGFINHIDIKLEIQISAISILTGDGSCFIVFRGTDSSFVGWKENFNMSFSETVPAQLEAVKYVEKIAPLTKAPLRLGGHSKGGNLAIYAASYCSKKIQKRITEIYSNDSPGFHKTVITSEGFAAIKDRICSFVPQSSIVGMFLEHGYENKVIKSSQFGLLQHSLYSWEVTHNDMIYVDDISLSSRYVDKTTRGWLNSVNVKQREQYIEALYAALTASGAKSLAELEHSWLRAAGRMIKNLGTMDKPTRAMINNTMKQLYRSAKSNLIDMLKPQKTLYKNKKT